MPAAYGNAVVQRLMCDAGIDAATSKFGYTYPYSNSISISINTISFYLK